jgi:hypothetical protein
MFDVGVIAASGYTGPFCYIADPAQRYCQVSSSRPEMLYYMISGMKLAKLAANVS